MRVEDTHRIRWLTRDDAKRLLSELPTHLADMVEFSLATGLREANVVGLQWKDIDIERCHAWIHPDQAKANKAISVPLNSAAMAVIRRRSGSHRDFVFTYKDKPVLRGNNHAWRKALKRAGIENFRWHDLRHTWASWHVQSGTTLQELQALGGWANFAMVLRYAHLSGEHLRGAAERIYETKLYSSLALLTRHPSGLRSKSFAVSLRLLYAKDFGTVNMLSHPRNDLTT